jgi:hypothetical protein
MQLLLAILLQAKQSIPPLPSTLKDIIGMAKDLTAAVQSLATVVALALGGIWTFRTFIKGRGSHPRAHIEHLVSHRILPDLSQLLILDVFIENVGQVAIALRSAETWVQQVLPLPGCVQSRIIRGDDLVEAGKNEGTWSLLGTVHQQKFEKGKYIIDSGERDQFRHNFLLPADVQTIQIYTYFEPVIGVVGWKLKTTYDLSQQTKMIVVSAEEPNSSDISSAHRQGAEQRSAGT